MGYSRLIVLALVVITAGVIWLGFCGCDDKGTEPIPGPGLTDYRAWFWSGVYNNRLFAYHPTTRQIDTVVKPSETGSRVTVSADGKRLYLAEVSSVTVVDTDSLSFIAQLPYGSISPPAVSPDNELVAILGNDLNILRTSDYSVIFSDTDRVEHGRFSADSKSFYCAAGLSTTSGALVYKVDLSDTTYPVVRHVFEDRSVSKIIPSNNESLWLLYNLLPPMWTWAFEVYDVQMDSIIYSHVLQPGAGNIEITPDGRYAFYTSPGTLSMGPTPQSSIWVYDIQANAIDRVIEANEMVDSSATPPTFLPYGMAVTPDNRWLVASSILWAHGQLLLYDLSREKLVDYIEFENDALGSNISVQAMR